jgi:hypothetical protein
VRTTLRCGCGNRGNQACSLGHGARFLTGADRGAPVRSCPEVGCAVHIAPEMPPNCRLKPSPGMVVDAAASRGWVPNPPKRNWAT